MKINVSDAEHYIVYAWRNVRDEPNYIEMCALPLFSDRLDEVRKNQGGIVFEVVAIVGDKIKAFNTMQDWQLANAKHIMMNVYEGKKKDTSSRRVECIDSGETFRSASYCAEIHMLGKGNLSNHLRGVPGFDTVKGRRYRWAAGNGF
jgi:hypothetical protein